MALSATEIKIIAHLIARARAQGGRTPRLLSLGYPDVLCTQEAIEGLDLPLSLEALGKRANAAEIWRNHGRDGLADRPMIEARAMLTALGADVTITDAISWGSEEIDFVLDLNKEISTDKLGQFDVVIDPGTLEHCFNVAQAFMNVDGLLAPEGYVYHQTTLLINHGFWGISPTAFYDFYELRGYDLGVAYRWGSPCDSLGLIPSLRRLNPFEAASDISPACYIFRKKRNSAATDGVPVQRCYSSLSRDPPLIDFVPRGVPR